MGEDDIKAEKDSSPLEKSNSKQNGERRTRSSKVDDKQPSILSMFSKM